MADPIQMQYDAAGKSALYTFKNGRTLTVHNLTEAQAKRFLERDAPEFERRDCRMHSVGGHVNREETGNG
jgi:hypothetical protein